MCRPPKQLYFSCPLLHFQHKIKKNLEIDFQGLYFRNLVQNPNHCYNRSVLPEFILLQTDEQVCFSTTFPYISKNVIPYKIPFNKLFIFRNCSVIPQLFDADVVGNRTNSYILYNFKQYICKSYMRVYG